MWPFKRRAAPTPTDQPTTGVLLRTAIAITPEEIQIIGSIPDWVIYGFVDETGPNAGVFRPNPGFAEFMQRWIAAVGPIALESAAAQKMEDTNVYIIDLRTPDGPQGRVPMEDIIGSFEVKERKVVPGSYWANPKHELHTENGPFRLPPPFDFAFDHYLKSTIKDLVQSRADEQKQS